MAYIVEKRITFERSLLLKIYVNEMTFESAVFQKHFAQLA